MSEKIVKTLGHSRLQFFHNFSSISYLKEKEKNPKKTNQGQFRNPQDELISKLSLLARFDKDLAEILEVKEKASISE